MDLEVVRRGLLAKRWEGPGVRLVWVCMLVWVWVCWEVGVAAAESLGGATAAAAAVVEGAGRDVDDDDDDDVGCCGLEGREDPPGRGLLLPPLPAPPKRASRLEAASRL